MIQIKRVDINDLVHNHYLRLEKKISMMFPSSCKYSIETILKAKPKQLEKIALWFDTLTDVEKQKYDFIRDSGYSNFSKKKKEYNAYDFAKALDICACPYCNRNYTFTVTNNENAILRPDIDHFYDKDSYPILALSFYNLIPSCIECNRVLKGTKEFRIDTHLHPYLDDFNSLARFEYKHKTKKDKNIYSKDRIDISINTKDERTQKITDDLKLEKVYNQGYKDIVLELIQKREIYPDSYIDDLFNQYEGTLFKNREDLLRLITGGYIEDKDIDKRPLSKLIKDISEELDLI